MMSAPLPPNHEAIEADLEKVESKFILFDQLTLGRLLDVCTPAEPELELLLISLLHRSFIDDPDVRRRVRDRDIVRRRIFREQRYRSAVEAAERNKVLAERLATASYGGSSGTIPRLSVRAISF